MNGITRDIFEIASLLIGVAALTMLVKNSRGTAEIVETVGDTFAGLISTATGQGMW